jgi:hypothetical protein
MVMRGFLVRKEASKQSVYGAAEEHGGAQNGIESDFPLSSVSIGFADRSGVCC